MAITTAVASSAKVEFLMGGHCFAATVTPTGSATSGSTSITGVSNVSGLAVGMSISNPNIPTGTVIAKITGTASLTISQATTGIITGGTLTCTGDTFNIALIKVSPTGVYSAATTNYSQLVSNGDEVVGTGYTAGGVALVSVGPLLAGTGAIQSFANPVWTGASFVVSGALIYNTGRRVNGNTGACIAVYDFGGPQTVTSGTFTVYFPPDVSGAAIIQIN